MARKKENQETAILEPITPTQQNFIEHLLSGKKISQAALLTGISRRTATYWLANEQHPVYLEFEKQSIQRSEAFTARIAHLHELALKAMEDALNPGSPPAIRFQAAKFLYEKHLERLCEVQEPHDAFMMVKEQTSSVSDREHFDTWNAHKIRDIPE